MQKKGFGVESNADKAQKLITDELTALQTPVFSTVCHPNLEPDRYTPSATIETNEDDLWETLDTKQAREWWCD